MCSHATFVAINVWDDGGFYAGVCLYVGQWLHSVRNGITIKIRFNVQPGLEYCRIWLGQEIRL